MKHEYQKLKDQKMKLKKREDSKIQTCKGQTEINNEGEVRQDEALAGTGLSKEDDKMGQRTETRVEEQPSNHVGGDGGTRRL